ncbi:hypothetical protein MVEN_02574500 [Mycena venus]|uniref:DUF6534 domain-containing protein n=1 Tax=Mycena venus TaxID=2733690 RepID=A0A8H6WRF8_9AGAR|nr:hypothetical protein MVEN_02574500 [Mycena venus]
MSEVDLRFGPMLIGVLLNMMLYGVVVTQMFTYYQRYTNDSAWIRYLMLYLLIVETANVVNQCGIIFEPLIIRYGTPTAINKIPKLLPADTILISIVSAPIQLFAAWRIRVITRAFILPGLVALLSLGAFGCGVNMSIKVYLASEFRNFGTLAEQAIVWLALSAACDVVIAVGLTHALYTRKTGFSVVDGQINRIIRLTLETGAFTALDALGNVMLFLVLPETNVNFIAAFPLSALYTCSILAMMNSRERRKTPDVEKATHTKPQGNHAQTSIVVSKFEAGVCCDN